MHSWKDVATTGLCLAALLGIILITRGCIAENNRDTNRRVKIEFMPEDAQKVRALIEAQTR